MRSKQADVLLLLRCCVELREVGHDLFRHCTSTTTSCKARPMHGPDVASGPKSCIPERPEPGAQEAAWHGLLDRHAQTTRPWQVGQAIKAERPYPSGWSWRSVRRMIRLGLAARMTRAAIDHAAELGAVASAAVVDAGGHLVHFQRMDGAEIAGPTLAVDKAYTALAHRISTAELGPLTVPGGPLQAMHANGGGRYVVFAGGLPCWSTEELPIVVGGIGVSGGSAEEDEACAQAALDVFTGEVRP